MKCVIRYNYDYLQTYCAENKITLIQDYSNIDINRETRIEGKCCTENCAGIFNKTFRYICLMSRGGGPLCKTCTDDHKISKQKKTFKEKYLDNLEMFQELKNRREATCEKRYNVKNPFQYEPFKEKGYQTMTAKYGETHIMKTEAGQENYRKVFTEQHGSDNPSKCEIF